MADASFNVEAWILDKVSRGFRATIKAAILLGDGIGKPFGLLNSQSGIPICEVSPATAVGQFTWQDLLMLKFQIPMQWLDGSAFYMNQNTFALYQCRALKAVHSSVQWARPRLAPAFSLPEVQSA